MRVGGWRAAPPATPLITLTSNFSRCSHHHPAAPPRPAPPRPETLTGWWRPLLPTSCLISLTGVGGGRAGRVMRVTKSGPQDSVEGTVTRGRVMDAMELLALNTRLTPFVI
ncbi:hypothetical protein Pcinc_043863 [Petrolisthes cinctipes]|uniref:Uncharacterized protein n=1 Tax=Petrolisthes cinctipes TaxID=88211 RepID=A0AAE1BFU2_PETCI|nr:hypothetical protein Pcinc_043863 [Petrolisthes cinctipes]